MGYSDFRRRRRCPTIGTQPDQGTTGADSGDGRRSRPWHGGTTVSQFPTAPGRRGDRSGAAAVTTRDRRVPVRYFALLLGWMTAHRIDVDRLLQAAGLARARLEQADGTLSQDEVMAFVGAARQVTGRGDLAFELGRLIKLNSHDVLGYGMLSCSSIDELLRLVARYYALITETFTLRYVRQPGYGEAIYTPLV